MLRKLQLHKGGIVLGFISGVFASIATSWITPSSNGALPEGFRCESPQSAPEAASANSQTLICQFDAQTTIGSSMVEQGICLLLAAMMLIGLSTILQGMDDKIKSFQTTSSAERDAVEKDVYAENITRIAVFGVLSALLLSYSFFGPTLLR